MSRRQCSQATSSVASIQHPHLLQAELTAKAPRVVSLAWVLRMMELEKHFVWKESNFWVFLVQIVF
jgi:hypothetical protein